MQSKIRFRVRKNAASLKQPFRTELVSRMMRFPRSKERGLIEASYQIPNAAYPYQFPRSKERGLIEAMDCQHATGLD